MNYDFRPRTKNIEVIKNNLPKKSFILITPPYNTNLMKKLFSCISRNRLHRKYLFLTCGYCGERFENIDNIPISNETTKIGYLIEIMKRSKLVIGPKSDLIHLSLLLKCPVISWGKSTNLNLMNPFGTRITMFNDVPYESIEKQLIQELGRKKNGTDYNCF